MHLSKKSLAVELSRLKTFTNPKVKLEQYPTDSESAAEFLWEAYMAGDIEDKTITDLGAGTGILGIGAYLLGARGVYFVEKDKDAVEDLKENLAKIQLDDNYTIFQKDVRDVELDSDVVIQNPPFGTRDKHADKVFLEKAKTIAKKEAGLDKEKADAKAKALEAEKEVSEKRAMAAAEALNEEAEAEITESEIVVSEEAGAEAEATEEATAVVEEAVKEEPAAEEATPVAKEAVKEEPVAEEAAPVAEEVVVEEKVEEAAPAAEEAAKEAAPAKAEDAAKEEGDTEEKPAASDKKE